MMRLTLEKAHKRIINIKWCAYIYIFSPFSFRCLPIDFVVLSACQCDLPRLNDQEEFAEIGSLPIFTFHTRRRLQFEIFDRQSNATSIQIFAHQESFSSMQPRNVLRIFQVLLLQTFAGSGYSRSINNENKFGG